MATPFRHEEKECYIMDTYEDRSRRRKGKVETQLEQRWPTIEYPMINRSRPNMDRSRYTNPGTVKFTWWIVLTIIMIYVGSVDPRNTKVLAGLLIFLRRTLHFGPPPPAAGAANSPTLVSYNDTTTTTATFLRLAGRNLGNSYVDRETIIIFPGYAACSEQIRKKKTRSKGNADASSIFFSHDRACVLSSNLVTEGEGNVEARNRFLVFGWIWGGRGSYVARSIKRE